MRISRNFNELLQSIGLVERQGSGAIFFFSCHIFFLQMLDDCVCPNTMCVEGMFYQCLTQILMFTL